MSHESVDMNQMKCNIVTCTWLFFFVYLYNLVNINEARIKGIIIIIKAIAASIAAAYAFTCAFKGLADEGKNSNTSIVN